MFEEDLTDGELGLMRRFARLGPGFSPETSKEKWALASLKRPNLIANGLTKDGWKALRQRDDDFLSD